MAQRLQVLLDEAEFGEIRRIATQEGLTVAEWVRRALSEARRRKSGEPAPAKHEAIRAALEHSFPTADIEEMLSEIERGYTASGEGGSARE
jgi:hypothetical protein